jgi:hypothetical protein
MQNPTFPTFLDVNRGEISSEDSNAAHLSLQIEHVNQNIHANNTEFSCITTDADDDSVCNTFNGLRDGGKFPYLIYKKVQKEKFPHLEFSQKDKLTHSIADNKKKSCVKLDSHQTNQKPHSSNNRKIIFLEENEHNPYITPTRYEDGRPLEFVTRYTDPCGANQKLKLWAYAGKKKGDKNLSTNVEKNVLEAIEKRRQNGSKTSLVFRLESGWGKNKASKKQIFSKFGILDAKTDIVEWTRKVPESQHQRCFYEYILGDVPQRLYFDLDWKSTNSIKMTLPLWEEWVHNILEIIKLEFKRLTNQDFNVLHSTAVFESHDVDIGKFSTHLVLQQWVNTFETSRAFQQRIRDLCNGKPFHSIVDIIANRARNFRLPGSHKYLKTELEVPRVKKLSPWSGVKDELTVSLPFGAEPKLNVTHALNSLLKTPKKQKSKKNSPSNLNETLGPDANAKSNDLSLAKNNDTALLALSCAQLIHGLQPGAVEASEKMWLREKEPDKDGRICVDRNECFCILCKRVHSRENCFLTKDADKDWFRFHCFHGKCCILFSSDRSAK